MKMRIAFLGTLISLSILAGCKQPTTISKPTEPPVSRKAAALPPEGFKAEITLPEPPAKLRTGQVQIITVNVKNTSSVVWWPAGGETTDRLDNTFYIAAGNRWLDKDGKRTSESEGHAGIPKVLKPGESVEMSLQITAPKEPGSWIMDLDMVQEGVAWFGDKGSPTTKVNIMVVK